MIPMRHFAPLFALLLAAPLAAQETPTEREAARDVLKKMAALEQSLDVPGLVAKLTAANAARDAVAARAKELMDKDLLALGDSITKHPEHGFVELEPVKKLSAYLSAHAFDVTMGTPGLATAFVARYKKNNGPPNLGVILEYDALRGTKGDFHGDQHSTQGPIGMAAAIAMAEYLSAHHLPGSVIVYGTPREEMMPPAPDRAVANFNIGHPDAISLEQLTKRVDDAAPAAALGTGTKVKTDHYGQARAGVAEATLAEVGFAYMKKFGATNVLPEPGKPQGFEETGTVSSAIPGLGFAAQTSHAPNHTYEMEADALTTVGHSGFAIAAKAMSALLFDFATRADYRAAVTKEVHGIKALFGEYQEALRKGYVVPRVPEPPPAP